MVVVSFEVMARVRISKLLGSIRIRLSLGL